MERNAKYTELFSEYLASGGELPAAFSQIEGFENLFVARYCDKEIGFETETLFKIKLEERAAIVIPAYVKRIEASDAAWLVVTDPTRKQTRTFDSGEKRTSTRSLPLNAQTAQPTQTATADAFTDVDSTIFEGMTSDEAIRRAEYFQKLDGTAWIMLDACLREFENLFMKVY